MANNEQKNQAHVICMNDGLEYVVIGSFKEASKRLYKMQKAYYNKNKQGGRWDSFESYCNMIFWHIHTVDCSFNSID